GCEATDTDRWAPGGFTKPDEAKLGESAGFLSETNRNLLTCWWLAKPGRANTPNWDLVSSGRMGERPGLILVEAKADDGELANDRCGATNQANFEQIENALAEATKAWNALAPGFCLAANRYYQLSNRFAFAWKLAAMGVPTILVYLGFLNAKELRSSDIL